MKFHYNEIKSYKFITSSFINCDNKIKFILFQVVAASVMSYNKFNQKEECDTNASGNNIPWDYSRIETEEGQAECLKEKYDRLFKKFQS